MSFKLNEFQKDNFKKKSLLIYIMNKRGEIVIFGAIILIVLTTAGIILTLSNSKNLYIGDTNSKQYINYFKCESQAKQIPESQLIIFKSEQEAVNLGYNATIGCV